PRAVAEEVFARHAAERGEQRRRVELGHRRDLLREHLAAVVEAQRAHGSLQPACEVMSSRAGSEPSTNVGGRDSDSTTSTRPRGPSRYSAAILPLSLTPGRSRSSRWWNRRTSSISSVW